MRIATVLLRFVKAIKTDELRANSEGTQLSGREWRPVVQNVTFCLKGYERAIDKGNISFLNFF